MFRKEISSINYKDLFQYAIVAGVIQAYDKPGFPICKINDATIQYLGYDSEDELLSASDGLYLNLFHPDDKTRFSENMADSLYQDENFLNLVFRLRKKNGNYIWVTASGQRALDSDGQYKIFGVVQDITKEVTASLNLTRKNGEINNLIDAIEGGTATYIYKDKKLSLLSYSSGVKNLASRSKEEYACLMGTDPFALIYEGNHDRIQKVLLTAINDKKSHTVYYRIKAVDGSHPWISNTFRVIGEVNDCPIVHTVFSNITERQKSYTAILDMSDRVIYISNIDTYELLYVNKKACEFAGKSKDSCVGRTCYEWIKNRFEPCSDCHMHRLNEEETGSYETYDLQKERWHNVYGKRIKWNEFNAIVEFISDISTQKNIEEKLRQEQSFLQERYNKALDDEQNLGNEQMAIIRFNLTKKYIERYVDHFVSRLELDIYEGMTLSESRNTFLLSAGNNDETKQHLEKLFNSDLQESYRKSTKLLTFTGKFSRRNGVDLWMKVTTRLRLHPTTYDLIAFVSIKDATYQNLISLVLSTTAFSWCDYVAALETVNWRYILFSSRIIPDEFYSGYFQEDMKKYLKYNKIDNVESIMTKLSKENILKELAHSNEYVIQYINNFDGKPHNKLLRLSKLPNLDNVLAISSLDITDFLKTEKESKDKIETALLQANKANNAKTEFLARMSHDMRTPMNGIKGMLALAMKSNRIAEIKEYLKKAELSSDLLLRLMNDVLDTSKIEKEQLSFVYEPYSLNDSLKLMDIFIKPLCDEKHIHYTLETTDNKNYILLTDKARLNQIYMNLLSNAVKFTPIGGEISLKNEIINETPTHLTYRIYIKDNGIGISDNFIPHLFEPFTKEARAGYEHLGGTGLGLSITKGLVDALGGTISAESEVNKGTQFTLEFTMEKCDEIKPMLSDENPLKLRGLHILIVEDNEINMIVAQLLLEDVGMITSIARNGQEAVELFEKSLPNTFDAILMDIRMPVIDGLEATRRIRAQKRIDAKQIPILAMSANAYEQDFYQSLQAGMNEHLSKPIEPKILYQVLQKHIQNVQEKNNVK